MPSRSWLPTIAGYTAEELAAGYLPFTGWNCNPGSVLDSPIHKPLRPSTYGKKYIKSTRSNHKNRPPTGFDAAAHNAKVLALALAKQSEPDAQKPSFNIDEIPVHLNEPNPRLPMRKGLHDYSAAEVDLIRQGYGNLVNQTRLPNQGLDFLQDERALLAYREEFKEWTDIAHQRIMDVAEEFAWENGLVEESPSVFAA